ncbi:MAG: hypothetical protein ACRDH7_05490 [Actinomycetota bacterium]
MSNASESWHIGRAAVPFLEPGERPGVVVRGMVGVDIRFLAIVYISTIVLQYRLFPVGTGDLSGSALRHQHHVEDLRLIWTLITLVAYLVALMTLVHHRWFVLTNQRLLIMRSTWPGATPRVLVDAEPLHRVRVDAIRRSFPGHTFGLRRLDGRTTQVRAGRRWRAEIEKLAGSLDAGVVAPSRPDAVSAG